MDFFLDYAIFIPLLPFAGFVIITLFSKALKERLCANISAGVTGAAMILGFLAFVTMIGKPAGYVYEGGFAFFDLSSGSSEQRSVAQETGARSTGGQSEDGGRLNPVTTDPEKHFDKPMGAFRYTVRIDKLAAMMLFMVTLACFLIHLFSVGYMRGKEFVPRFHSFMCLFTMAMLGLVLTGSLLIFYIFWEIMGLCSYLLIGFYFKKKSAMAAAKKAFITTRIGDVGLILGIIVTFMLVGSFDFGQIWAAFPTDFPVGSAAAMGHNPLWVGAAGLLLFMGTVGKSAQFPLHVWLPDAMEGPTPVSAMIHAATMVSAGIYLLGKVFPIIRASTTTLLVVALVGGITVLIAALLASVMNDIKKVLAYSTISQLGFMVLALGAAGWVGAMFHLITHAFFKACLFLGSGSVIIGCHHQKDMRYMGALRKYMPITFITFTMAALALVGFPLFSGWFSKDEILVSVFDMARESGIALYWVLFVFAMIAAFLTAFYMTRLIAMTFLGDKYRGDEAPKNEEVHAAKGRLPKESPLNMTIPLIVLGTLGAFFGFVGIPEINPWFQRFVQDGLFSNAHLPEVNWFVLGLSTFMGLSGIAVGWLVFVRKSPVFSAISARFQWLRMLLENKYYLDDLYIGILSPLVVRRLDSPRKSLAKLFYIFDQHVIDLLVNAVAAMIRLFSRLSGWFDRIVVDGLVNCCALVWMALNFVIRRVQSGQIQTYLFVILIGAVLILILSALEFGLREAGINFRLWADMTPIG